MKVNMNNMDWVRYSVTFRIAIIGILALLLLIPVSMVEDLIYERERVSEEAVSEVSQKWGEPQVVAGPVLSVPYKKYITNEKGERVSVTQYVHFLPQELSINSVVEPQIRSRGIFDVVVYSSEIDFSGKFAQSDIRDLGIEDIKVDWDNAFISLGISDVRGIQDNVKINWNGDELQFKPGIQTDDVLRNVIQSGGRADTVGLAIDKKTNLGQNSGISARLPEGVEEGNGFGHTFSFKLNLNGSQEIQFVPVGRTTEVALKSSWGSPSFNGAFLPDMRTVGDDGFEASWKIFDLNRGYPQSWIGDTHNIYSSAFGAKLLITVDGYKKATRSVKYALLIIALTFLVFFFAEAFNKKRIHLIQYILVGLSMVLFYALLVSISEITGFGWAYLISSVATISLIVLYSKSVLANTKMALTQGFILTFLYLFVYIILQLEDYALLMGSVLLFSILAIVMYLSRRVDWYAIGSNTQEDAPQQ